MKRLYFRNGDGIPALGLGTWKSKRGEVFEAVKTAIQLGYRHIDCAPIYGNEKEIGEALKECFESKLVTREELWITSKLWNDSHRDDEVVPALKNTLSDLQLDYLDLFLIHWPVALDKEVYKPGSPEGFISLEKLPINETWKGMEGALSQGLTKHIGVCNFSVKKLKDLLVHATVKPEMNQLEMHPYLSQPEMVSFCKDNGILITAYSPLGSFDRSPKVKAADEPVLLNDPVVAAIAKNNNHTPAQVLLAWALQRGTVVIPKSVNADRLKQNLEADGITLSVSDMETIDQLNKHYRYISGSFWTPHGSPYTLASLWDE